MCLTQLFVRAVLLFVCRHSNATVHIFCSLNPCYPGKQLWLKSW